MVNRYDFINITNAQLTKEGFIKDSPVITRAGIFTYRTKDGKTRKEYRADEEVFKAESLATLAGIPITDNHVGMASGNNSDHVVGSTLSVGRQDGKNVVADVIIHNVKRIGKKRELSAGYSCEIDETPGEINGERYDCIQTNITYNHLAVVHAGRAGNARLRLDAADAVNGNFDNEDMVMDPKLVAVRIDNLDYVASPEVARSITKLETDLAAQAASVQSLTGERDTLKKQIEDKDAEIEKVRKATTIQIRGRIKLENDLNALGVKIEEADTDRVIREKALKAWRKDIDLTDKSDDYVASAFDTAMVYELERKQKTGTQRERADSGKWRQEHNDKKNTREDAAEDTSAMGARERMLKRIREGKKAA